MLGWMFSGLDPYSTGCIDEVPGRGFWCKEVSGSMKKRSPKESFGRWLSPRVLQIKPGEYLPVGVVDFSLGNA